MKNIGHYAKGIIATAGTVITALQPIYGSNHWFIALTSGLTTLSLILVPNAPKVTEPAVKANSVPDNKA